VNHCKYASSLFCCLFSFTWLSSPRVCIKLKQVFSCRLVELSDSSGSSRDIQWLSSCLAGGVLLVSSPICLCAKNV
jgi:hypothetical protein